MADAQWLNSDNEERSDLHRTIREFLAARLQGDVATYLEFFAPKARLNIPGNPVLNPLSGTRIGREDIGKQLVRMRGQNIYLHHEIEDIISSRDMVAAHWRVTIRSAATGQERELEILTHLRLEDRQIVEMSEYFDTGAVSLMRGHLPLRNLTS
jgi:ketosteroid isomerase-like protein